MKQYNLREVNTAGEEKTITLGENDLIRIYALYKKVELKEDIENIIKVQIPQDETAAMDILKNGFEHNDKKYITLQTTVNMLKHEDKEAAYSMEYFFVAEEDKEFVKYLESLASLDKLKEKDGKKLCINKDIVSRLSLLTSTGDRVYLPNLKKAILPEMTYDFINNYLQFAEENKKGRTLPNQKLELVKHPNESVPHTAMDGSGFIMPNVMKDIQKQLKVSYPLSWIGIREIGVASKGLLVKFDFKKYLREEHGINSLIVKDMWNNDVDLFQVDVIQNASQVKWGKWFDSAEHIEELKLNFPEAEKLLNGFNICKYNKKQPKAYTKANYQIMSNLALTPVQLEEIAAEHKDIYTRVIDREEHATRIMLGDIAREEELDLSASTKVHRLIQLDSKMLTLQSSYKVMESLVNKSVHTLAGGSIYVKGNYKVVIKDAISYFNSLINPEYIYKEGKLKAIKGYMSADGLQDNQNYVPNEIGNRTLARCPLNSATELIKTTLVENQLYKKYFGNLSSDIMFYPFNDYMMRQSGADEDLDIALAIDNETIFNAVIEDIDSDGVKWYFRNQFDGRSSEVEYSKEAMYSVLLEVRGNKIGQLSNKGAIVSNLIQEMPYKFLTGDGIKYISLGMFKSQIEKKVNLKFIQEKADIRANYEKDDLKEKMQEFNRKIERIIYAKLKEKKELIKALMEEGRAFDYTQLTDTEIVNFINKNFQHFKKYSYYLLYLQMVAIDQPKTNLTVEKWMEKPLFAATGRRAKKPSYIYHAKYKQANAVVKYSDCKSSNTLLCNFAKGINTELGHTARAMEEDIYNNKELFKVLGNACKDANQDCIDTLKLLEDKYHYLRSEIPERFELATEKEKREELGHYKAIRDLEKKITETRYSKDIAPTAKNNKLSNLHQQKEKLEDERKENKTELLDVEANITRLNAKITEEFNRIDLIIAEDFKETVQTKHNDKVILRSLYEVRRPNPEQGKKDIKASCRFILNFAFEELEKELIEQKQGVGTMYKEDINGEIKYLNTNYSIINVELVSLELDKKEQLKKKEKLGELKRTRGGLTTDVENIEGTLELREEGNNINFYAEDKKLGFIYPDCKGAVEGLEAITIKEIEIAKNKKSVTIYF
ncbi:hypothetical protein [uncultured Clostridium sp.]|uniref:hypothetical protein n=1 Tax=uncultured Clostridium sp. TaxID=59620 RepID=UPI002622A39B|nr:hypothetical protein [uncultured Clostridium sp.]